jgi:SAM-dependent methyltransferase
MQKTNKETIYPEGKAVTACHMCRGVNLRSVLDLGFQPHSDLFLTPEQLKEPLSLYPLRLVSCADCGLLQIDFLVDPRILYQKEYLYESSITSTGRAHYNEMARQIIKKFDIKKDSLAVDLGSNVGVLLEGFKDNGMKVLGVDPAPIVAQKAIDRGIETIIDFFGRGVAEKIRLSKGRATVIAGTNVFAHIHEIDSAVEGMKMLLDDQGVIVIEAPYAIDFIEHLEYDTIYHQHVGYLSVRPMQKYFKRFGLELFDVDGMKIHGGSLRYYVGHEGAHPVSSTIAEHLEREENFGLYKDEVLDQFAEKVKLQRLALVDLLLTLKKEGKRIVGISAPAKGNTLLNYCKLDTAFLDFLTEKSKLKIGRYSPGMSIPIFDDAKLLEEKPDYALILAWNFAEEIMKNMSTFKEGGGKFIIPIPYPKIV